MMSHSEALRLALDSICGAKLCEINSISSRHEMIRLMDEAIAAIKQVMEQPEPEPVACAINADGSCRCRKADLTYACVDYTSPPKREPLTEAFVVKHYASDERPIIKGNGFDGLEIGENREEAEAFVAWINERLAAHGIKGEA